MAYARIEKKLVTWPMVVLALIMLAGLVAAGLRMVYGLGVTTNLTDTWPWGVWKGFNVLVLIALGAGGFTSAALIYIFGGDRYYSYARPTALWGFLCYSFAGASLMVDIAIPWRIVNPIYMWPEHSILFEVAWCVMLYVSVLGLEVLPGVFERFGWKKMEAFWRQFVPYYAVGGLTFFTYIMTHSMIWAAISLVFFSTLSILFKRVRNEPSVPVLLIMFGVILSTLHQSSLGSLFLLVPDKLSHFWWSPRLPINFYLSAITIGFAMLVVERTITSRVFGFELPNAMLSRLSRIFVTFLWATIAFRLVDLLVAFIGAADFGGAAVAFGGGGKALLFVTELFIGMILPALILTWPKGREQASWRVVAAILLVFGVALNRLNVTFMGMNLPGVYIPSLIEVLVALATFAAIIFLFTLTVKLLPIYQKPGAASSHGA